jgi:integrase
MEQADKAAENTPKKVPYWRRVGISIEQVTNRSKGADFGQSWLVIIPTKVTGNGRIRKQFKTYSKALNYAEGKADLARASGKRAFVLNDGQREDAAEALRILGGLQLSLTEAATLARRHLTPEGGDITLRALVDRILREKERENLRPASVQSIRFYMGQIADQLGEERLVKTVARDELRHWFDTLEDTGASDRYLKNHIRYTQQFFNYAVQHGYRADNPAAIIRPPRIEWKTPAILTVGEAKRLLCTAMLPEFKELLPATVLQLFCGGLRSAEVERLDWRDIDLENKKLEVLPATGKNRRDGDWRTPVIPDNAIEFLFLHPNRKGPVAPGRFPFKQTAMHKAAGFKKWEITHDNAKRHSFGSYGCKLHGKEWVEDQMGHNTGATFLKFYRNARVTKQDAEQYFDIRPANLSKDTVGDVVAIEKGA